MFDLVLRGATVVDGTGKPSFEADVAIQGGRVAMIGHVVDPALETVELNGAVVCPGFVDVHTHYDAQLLWDTTAHPSVLHGVTTVLGGNCGFSIAPLAHGDAAYIQRMMAVVEGIPLEAMEESAAWDWTSFDQYLDRIDGGLAVNAGFLVGHSTVRRAIMGADAASRAATEEQILAMAALVEESLSGGALGFSSSLGEGHTDGDGRPVPSRSASFEELIALARTLRAHPGTTFEIHPDRRADLRRPHASYG